MEWVEMKKTIISLTLLPALISLTLLGCSRSPDEATSASYNEEWSDRPVAVEGMTVSVGLLIPEVRGAGIVEGIREAWVVSEAEGLVRDVSFSLGDRVQTGEILLTLDAELAARNRDSAVQRYETALLEYLASEKSKNSGSMSSLQFSQVTDRLLDAEAAMAAAIEAYENTRITAPFAGAIAVKDSAVEVGDYLSRGVRVARIVDDSAFRTVISVGEGQVLLIENGNDAQIIGKDGIVRSGTVTAISAGTDSRTGSYSVVVEWQPVPGDRLRSGMSVTVAVDVVSNDEVAIIPTSAVLDRGDDQYVFVDEDGTVSRRMIRTGSRLGDRIEVLDGLEQGETLITSGIASLTDGASATVTIVGLSGGA
jgi:membrane fusion protein (multidrug efflux system)